jgi:Rrf2 family iron-sulfur cluster assembly transcriptional regulator
MRLSRRGRYALTALLDLVLSQEKKGLSAAKEIAKRQKIPLPFLEQLLSSMKRYRLVESKRGPKGGYLLARPASEISVFQVFSAVEEPLAIVECLAHTNCLLKSSCLTRPLWDKMNRALVQILHETSLEDLCQQKSSI